MSTLDEYRLKMEMYKVQVQMYAARVEAATAAALKFGTAIMDPMPEHPIALPGDQIWGAPYMATSKKVYEVFEASNGYFAQLASGRVVVGKTLAEVTTDANAAVTEELTANPSGSGPTPDDPLGQRTGWQKGLTAAAAKAVWGPTPQPPGVLDELHKILTEIDMPNGAKIKLYKGKPPPVDSTHEVSGADYAHGPDTGILTRFRSALRKMGVG